eukprot:superscaffoldBa00000850_g7593
MPAFGAREIHQADRMEDAVAAQLGKERDRGVEKSMCKQCGPLDVKAVIYTPAKSKVFSAPAAGSGPRSVSSVALAISALAMCSSPLGISSSMCFRVLCLPMKSRVFSVPAMDSSPRSVSSAFLGILPASRYLTGTDSSADTFGPACGCSSSPLIEALVKLVAKQTGLDSTSWAASRSSMVLRVQTRPALVNNVLQGMINWFIYVCSPVGSINAKQKKPSMKPSSALLRPLPVCQSFVP